MQPSTSLAENRVVTVLRWVARVVGVLVALVLGLWVVVSFVQEPGGTPGSMDPAQWALWAILGAGLLLGLLGNVFWQGVGEVVGGLLLVVGAVWVAINGGFEFMALEATALFAVPGALFIACGWYAIAHHQPGTRHVTA